MSQKTWKTILKRLLCYYFFVGHKFIPGPNGHKQCSRCGEMFFNRAKVVHKHRRLRHNIYGKNFFKNKESS